MCSYSHTVHLLVVGDSFISITIIHYHSYSMENLKTTAIYESPRFMWMYYGTIHKHSRVQ